MWRKEEMVKREVLWMVGVQWRGRKSRAVMVDSLVSCKSGWRWYHVADTLFKQNVCWENIGAVITQVPGIIMSIMHDMCTVCICIEFTYMSCVATCMCTRICDRKYSCTAHTHTRTAWFWCIQYPEDKNLNKIEYYICGHIYIHWRLKYKKEYVVFWFYFTCHVHVHVCTHVE